MYESSTAHLSPQTVSSGAQPWEMYLNDQGRSSTPLRPFYLMYAVDPVLPQSYLGDITTGDLNNFWLAGT